VLLDRDVQRLWNTLFNANVVYGQEKTTTVCLENILGHRNSHTKNQKMLGAPPNYFRSSQAFCSVEFFSPIDLMSYSLFPHSGIPFDIFEQNKRGVANAEEYSFCFGADSLICSNIPFILG
jgi:hypothetical protein